MLRRIAPQSLLAGWRLLWERSPGWAAASVAPTLLQPLLSLAALGLLKLVMDVLSAAIAGPRVPADFTPVALLIALTAAVVAVTGLCASMSAFIAEIQGDLVRDHVANVIHAKAVEVDLAYFETPHFYNTLHRAQ